MICNICPRKCNIDRTCNTRGFCGESEALRVARIAPHYFEEPPISGTRGSGTVFFSGCSLKCVFCQNKTISRENGIGREISAEELYERILELQESGVHNINLVTPTHFVHALLPLLEKLKSSGDLRIPIVYNSSGYERAESLKTLDGLVDIYMPDFKYASSELAERYSAAADYPEVAEHAICEMLRQRGRYRYSSKEPDLLESGVLVRHLVLPTHRADSIEVLHRLRTIADPNDILISLMSQYTPDFALDTPYKNLHRRITSFEYSSVCQTAEKLGFVGFEQQKEAAVTDYTPDFSERL
jgi:putative pyruvate formate lyase activating enzyme